jgi:hypothetical protein
MKDAPDPMDCYRQALPPAPRWVPPEIETLLGELGDGTRPRVLLLSLAILVGGLTLLPEAIRWARLDLRGETATARVLDAPVELSRHLWGDSWQVRIAFSEPTGARVQVRHETTADVAQRLHEGDTLIVHYDPLDPQTVRLWSLLTPSGAQSLAGIDPVRVLAGFVAFALALPLVAALVTLIRARRRRHAFRMGEPQVARVRGYTRRLGQNYISLELRRDESGSHTVREPISPSEVDRYPPLTDVITMVAPLPRGRETTLTVGLLDPIRQ